MADHAVDNFDGDIFIYRGGRAPQHITHVLIDKSVDEIEERAFSKCENLVQVDTHDGIRRIRENAFRLCKSLRWINLKSAFQIDDYAFCHCKDLESVEFGDQLETIGFCAFSGTSLKHLNLASIITIGEYAFNYCECLTDVELSKRLERMGSHAFGHCPRLQRIAIPLKRDLFSSITSNGSQSNSQFYDCQQLVTVDLVGGIHKTVASLHMDSWRTEMIAEINRINQVLPSTDAYGKTPEIRRWVESAADKMNHYKAEHYRYVKEGITLLELALWKAKLGEKEGSPVEVQDSESVRKERRIMCGADIVIKNVLPFLQLLE